MGLVKKIITGIPGYITFCDIKRDYDIVNNSLGSNPINGAAASFRIAVRVNFDRFLLKSIDSLIDGDEKKALLGLIPMAVCYGTDLFLKYMNIAYTNETIDIENYRRKKQETTPKSNDDYENNIKGMSGALYRKDHLREKLEQKEEDITRHLW